MAGNNAIFERLYTTETASVRAYRSAVSDQAEEQSRKLRLEEDLLVDCTFTPKTKWRLAAEKRKRAKEALERLEEDDANQKIPTPSERELRDRMFELRELKECTFKPRTKWNIIKERRSSMSRGELLWDDDPDDDVVKQPIQISTKGDEEPKKEPEQPVANPKDLPPKATPSKMSVKTVTKEEVKEESGKNTTLPTVVRSNYIGSISPSTPEWKLKFEKIGAKTEDEVILTAQGQAPSSTMQVRGASTIVAGGTKISPSPRNYQSPTGIRPEAKIPDTGTSKTVPKKTTPKVEKKKENSPAVSSVGGFRVAQKAPAPSTVGGFRVAQKTVSKDEDSARLKAKAEKEARLKAEEEARLAAEAKAKAEAEEAKVKAEEEARLKAEEEARLAAEAKAKAEEEARLKAEEEARLAAEAKAKAEEEARLKAEEEARLAAEAKAKAEEEARLKAEEEARLAEEAKAKAEEEARLAEEAKAKAEEEARLKAEEEARLAAEANAKAEEEEEEEEEARLVAEAKAEEETQLATETNDTAEEDVIAKAPEEETVSNGDLQVGVEAAEGVEVAEDTADGADNRSADEEASDGQEKKKKKSEKADKWRKRLEKKKGRDTLQ